MICKAKDKLGGAKDDLILMISAYNLHLISDFETLGYCEQVNGGQQFHENERFIPYSAQKRLDRSVK